MEKKPLAQVVREAYSALRTRWAGVPLDQAAFEKHVLRLGLTDDVVSVRADDVFMVAAVLEGTANALERFDQYLATAAGFAARVDRTPAFIDEVKQELRVSLLTGADPKLWSYSGTGALADWLRVVAVRSALNMKRSAQPRSFGSPPEAMPDQEAMQIKRWYLDDMRGALEAGFLRLSPRERTLLRLHFVDGLNIERIGAIYSVHRATVARWLVTIRRQLFEDAKAQLATKHGLDTADFRSLYRLMEEEVHLSVSRILSAG